MKNLGIKIPFKTIAQQADALRHLYPDFKVLSSDQTLRVTGVMIPTARSEPYTVKIRYSLKEKPDIRVLRPMLIENWKGQAIPHTYSEKKLCLYDPLYGDFKYSDLLSETILPWTSLWLYHYENWHMTGRWLGGGSHPSPKH